MIDDYKLDIKIITSCTLIVQVAILLKKKFYRIITYYSHTLQKLYKKMKINQINQKFMHTRLKRNRCTNKIKQKNNKKILKSN